MGKKRANGNRPLRKGRIEDKKGIYKRVPKRRKIK
jgi:hypothetical protein